MSRFVPEPTHYYLFTILYLAGAQIMNSISELIIRGEPTAEAHHQAESWAVKGLEILVKATEESQAEKCATCEVGLAVSLVSLGALREVLYNGYFRYPIPLIWFIWIRWPATSSTHATITRWPSISLGELACRKAFYRVKTDCGAWVAWTPNCHPLMRAQYSEKWILSLSSCVRLLGHSPAALARNHDEVITFTAIEISYPPRAERMKS